MGTDITSFFFLVRLIKDLEAIFPIFPETEELTKTTPSWTGTNLSCSRDIKKVIQKLEPQQERWI